MRCIICGTESAKFTPGKGGSLCSSCNEDTPKKVSQLDFDVAYWPNASSVPTSVRQSFYSDYLCSSLTLQRYIVETSTLAAGTLIMFKARGKYRHQRTGIILRECGPTDEWVDILLEGRHRTERRWKIAEAIAG